MAPAELRRPGIITRLALLAAGGIALASCTAGSPGRATSTPAVRPAHASASPKPEVADADGHAVRVPGSPLAAPASLVPFRTGAAAGQGRWQPAGRHVRGVPAVYETVLVPPGGTQPAGIAWMNAPLLSARLYSGSISPGGGPYRYTAPIRPAQAASLVAAFNGGFKMADARGGYYTAHRTIDPLRPGAASLVIYANGSVNVGAWGQDVTMSRRVASVRQNLLPLVAGGRLTHAAGGDWHAWGSTCGITSCAASVPGIEHQWRSGLGSTADGALVYVAGPALNPLQLGRLLVRAGAVRGMELDINPNWPAFATYAPPPGGRATPANGSKLLPASVQGPATFFESSWARDFITISARPTG